MKMLKTIPVLTLITFLFTGCDPARMLVIKAANKNNVSVTVYTNNRIVPFSLSNDTAKLIVQVPLRDSSIKTFNYGIGNWPDAKIDDLSANIDSVVINNTTGKVVLLSQRDIGNYLKQHRSGNFGSILTIEAK